MDIIPNTVFQLYVQAPKPGESWRYNNDVGANGDFLVPTQIRSVWIPPVAYPQDNKIYNWDEDVHQANNSLGWVEA